MTQFVYPRLPFYAAQERADEIADAHRSHGLGGLEPLVAFTHAKAEPVATGGRVADDTQIEHARTTALMAAGPWLERGAVSRADAGAFDLAIGRALHDSLAIIPGDAAHDETWNFLSLVVMPDLVVLRFPDMHPDRMFGTLRNPLRGAWLRRDTLGDLTDRYDRPLGVDEMVGLFERSEMARNRPLIRALAKAVMEYNGRASRSAWAREVFKEIRYATGPRALDGMTEEEIEDLIRGVGTVWSLVTRAKGQIDLSWPREGIDVGEEFHVAMVRTCERARDEVGYDATDVLRVLADEGAVAAARQLVTADDPNDRFAYLRDRGRLDIAVEALVLDERFAGLFEDEVLERARWRLAEAIRG